MTMTLMTADTKDVAHATGEQARTAPVGAVMDMSQFLHRMLTNDELKTRAGLRYEGRILRVVVEPVFNKYKKNKVEPALILTFEDGWDWIPNRGACRDLAAAWGTETDHWVGRRLAVQLVIVERASKATGRMVRSEVKRAEPLEDDEVSDAARAQRG
jgi:hypothetical protein